MGLSVSFWLLFRRLISGLDITVSFLVSNLLISICLFFLFVSCVLFRGFPVFLFKESLLRSVEIMDLGVGFCFGVWACALLSLWPFGLLSRLEAV
nr:unnamed protein product [Gossypium raimondii]